MHFDFLFCNFLLIRRCVIKKNFLMSSDFSRWEIVIGANLKAQLWSMLFLLLRFAKFCPLLAAVKEQIF